ncbi:MAG: cytochrome b/b6 domain-containing protein [Usitatibacter sp.]
MREAGLAADQVAVWDLPLRIFHWTLAGLVVFSFVTGKVAGPWLEWHMRSGYAILALVLFRLAWGVVGSQTARFTAFVRGPRAGLEYLEAALARRPLQVLGHNPLGGWMVVFMLALLLVQAATGLFVDDEIATQGPLAGTVSNALVARFTTLHRYNEWVILGAVVLHLVVIAAYHWGLRVNLVGPMVHGHMAVRAPVEPPRTASTLLAGVLFALACAAVYWLVIIFPRAAA